MNRGFSIIELILSLTIIVLVSTALLGEVFYGQKNTLVSGSINRAGALAQEGIEIIKNIRDASFFDLDATAKSLNFSPANKTWSLSQAPELIDGIFRREIKITDLGTDRKEVTVTVSNINTPAANFQLATRFANWFNSIEDWSQISLGGSFDFTPENSGANNHNAQTVSANGNYLYIGNANSNGKEFVVLNLSDAPNLSIEGAMDLDGSPAAVAVLGNYVFVSSGSNTQELQVVNVVNPTNPVLAASFNLTSGNSGNENNDAIAISASGNSLVLGRENSAGQELFVFDISNPSQPILNGKSHLNGSPKDLKIIGNKVFAASTDDNQELQVIDISDPTLPFLVIAVNLDQGDDDEDGLSLDGNATRLYLGREDSVSAPEFYIFNITNPSQPVLGASFDLGKDNEVVHISLSEDNSKAFILTNEKDTFQVINISNDYPTLLSSVNLNGSPNQADYSPIVQKMFVVGHANPEIQIISPALINQPIP